MRTLYMLKLSECTEHGLPCAWCNYHGPIFLTKKIDTVNLSINILCICWQVPQLFYRAFSLEFCVYINFFSQ